MERYTTMKKNIKPAPDPFYTLDKYYGNLSIQEYRKLLKHDRLLLVVDKPLTRSLPELHEDNDEFTINNKALLQSLNLDVKETKNNLRLIFYLVRLTYRRYHVNLSCLYDKMYFC